MAGASGSPDAVDEKIYVHRIGRTGRAGHSGTAITFVDWDDIPRWRLIARALGLPVAEPVETYHTSDHLYTDLGIPREVTGTLPRSKRVLAGLDAEEIEDLGETGLRERGRGGRSGRGGRGARSERERGRGARSAGGSRGRGAGTSGDKPRRTRKRTRGGKPVTRSED